MRYTDAYIESKDIDWFCKIGDMNIHVASAGGAIPDVVNDRERLRRLQNEVALLEDKYTDEEIMVNEQNLTILEQMYGGGENKFSREAYLESFMAMARKGFISLDRTHINDPNDNRYHIVCMPNSNDKTPHIDGIPVVPITDRFLPECSYEWVKNHFNLLSLCHHLLDFICYCTEIQCRKR